MPVVVPVTHVGRMRRTVRGLRNRDIGPVGDELVRGQVGFR